MSGLDMRSKSLFMNVVLVVTFTPLDESVTLSSHSISTVAAFTSKLSVVVINCCALKATLAAAVTSKDAARIAVSAEDVRRVLADSAERVPPLSSEIESTASYSMSCADLSRTRSSTATLTSDRDTFMLRSARSVNSVAATSRSAPECHTDLPAELMLKSPDADRLVSVVELSCSAASEFTASPAASVAWMLVPRSSNELSTTTCPVPSGWIRTSASEALDPMKTPAADTMLISSAGLCDHSLESIMLKSPVTEEADAR